MRASLSAFLWRWWLILLFMILGSAVSTWWTMGPGYIPIFLVATLIGTWLSNRLPCRRSQRLSIRQRSRTDLTRTVSYELPGVNPDTIHSRFRDRATRASGSGVTKPGLGSSGRWD